MNSLHLAGNVGEAAHTGHKSTCGMLDYRDGSAVKKAVLPENQGSIPSTYVVHNFKSSSRGQDTLFWPPWVPSMHMMHIYADQIPIHIK